MIPLPKATSYLTPTASMIVPSGTPSSGNTFSPTNLSSAKTLADCATAGLDLFQKTHLAPFEYYQSILRPQIKRFVTNPTRPEVQTIGHLRFDHGFAQPISFEIVNFGYTPLKLWRELLRHPRRTVRDIIFQANHWPGAYINYYHLFGLRRLLIIIGRLRGKAQFF